MAGPWDVVSEEKIGASGGNPWAVVSQEPLQAAGDKFTLPQDPFLQDMGKMISNVPSSAGNFAQALVHPFLHPVDTAESLYKLAKGVGALESPKQMVPVTLPSGQTVYRPQEVQETPEAKAQRDATAAPARAVGQFYKDRYGGLENIRNTLVNDPVGAAADAATILTGGGSMLARAPSAVGTVGQVLKGAGNVIDPLNAAMTGAQAAGTATKYLATSGLGRTTGVGGTVIRQAFDEGAKGGKTAEVFRENMRGADPEGMVGMADSALNQMRAERSANYEAGMGGVRKDATVLDIQPIVDTFADTVKIGTYKGKTINPSAVETQNKILDAITEWKNLDPAEYHTPAGFDALKQHIGDIRDNTQPGSRSRVIANKVYDSVKAEIEKQAPDYAKTMAEYAKASDRLKQIQKSFARSENAATETAVGRLLSTARNNVTSNYSQRRKLLDELAKYEPALPAAIAGQTLNSYAPRGLTANLAGTGGMGAAVAFSNPGLLAAAPAFMPRVVGEAAYGAGAATRPFRKIDPELLRRAGLVGYQAGRVSTVPGLLGQ